MSYISDYENSFALNEMMDVFSAFVDTYREGNDDRANPYVSVARRIKEELLRDQNLCTDDVNHPFAKYATDSKVENVRNLALTIMGMSNSSAERDACLSFFHSGGANRDDLLELMDEYYEFVDCVLSDGNDSDTDSESSDSESDEPEDADSPLNTAMYVPRLQGGPFQQQVVSN